MSLLSRIGRVFNSEANSAVDKLEDPTKIAEQILRELKANLQQAIEGEAEIKAISLGHRSEEIKARGAATIWEKKASDLLDMIDNEKLEATKGNNLANKAAESVLEYEEQADNFKSIAEKEEKALDVMDLKIKAIRNQIDETENKVRMLKARQKTAEVSEKLNKTLSCIDTDGLITTLNRMDEKVSAQEFRAQAYAEVADSTLSISSEIDKVLEESHATSALDVIKKRRNK